MLRGLLVALVFIVACSRSELDGAALPGGRDAGEDGCATVKVGAVARTPAIGQVAYAGGVIDPDDDVFLVVGGLSGSGKWAQSISAVSLGTGASTALTRAGDANVSLGVSVRALWEPTYHRTIALGGGLSLLDPQLPRDDLAQVFAIKVAGASAVLTLLPKFPEGETADVALAAAVDPIKPRLFAIPEKGGVAGPMHTYALDVTPGHEAWSLFDTDDAPALANVQLVSLSYDPVQRRLLGVGNVSNDPERSMWALSIDSPAGWTRVPGTFPPSLAAYAFVLGAGLPLVWDAELCAFVIAVTGTTCVYEAWRFDVGDTFVATSLGVAPQPLVRYGRGVAGFDARRRNFVFGSAFDCDFGHDYVAASTDFLPVVP